MEPFKTILTEIFGSDVEKETHAGQARLLLSMNGRRVLVNVSPFTYTGKARLQSYVKGDTH
jgi:hypothetical protein